MSFLPEPLLKEIDWETIGVEDFLGYLAKARYLEEIHEIIHANAIAKVFQEQ